MCGSAKGNSRIRKNHIYDLFLCATMVGGGHKMALSDRIISSVDPTYPTAGDLYTITFAIKVKGRLWRCLPAVHSWH